MTPFEQWARTAKDFSSQSVWDAATKAEHDRWKDFFTAEIARLKSYGDYDEDAGYLEILLEELK